MDLYGTPTSPYTRIVRIVAAEFGCELALKEIRWRETPESLFAINPAGRIPALVDGSESVFESRVICDYIMHRDGARRRPDFRRPYGQHHWSEQNIVSAAYSIMDAIMLQRGFEHSSAVEHPYLDRSRARISHCLEYLNRVGDKGYLVDPDTIGMAEISVISMMAVASHLGYIAGQSVDLMESLLGRYGRRPSISSTAPEYRKLI